MQKSSWAFTLTRLRTNFCLSSPPFLPNLTLRPLITLRSAKKRHLRKVAGWRSGVGIGQWSHERYGIPPPLHLKALTLEIGQGHRLPYHPHFRRYLPFYTSRTATKGFRSCGELESTATRYPGLPLLNRNGSLPSSNNISLSANKLILSGRLFSASRVLNQ